VSFFEGLGDRSDLTVFHSKVGEKLGNHIAGHENDTQHKHLPCNDSFLFTYLYGQRCVAFRDLQTVAMAKRGGFETAERPYCTFLCPLKEIPYGSELI
jgi:hypothetical protein